MVNGIILMAVNVRPLALHTILVCNYCSNARLAGLRSQLFQIIPLMLEQDTVQNVLGKG